MSTLGDDVERLKAEARERWGDAWTVKTRHFADGDTQAFAVHSRGRTGDGLLERDRLFVSDEGDVAVERARMERREVDTDTVEAPTPSA